MQDLLKNEKIKPLLKRRNSRELIEKIEISVHEKKEKYDKIKNLLKDCKSNNVMETTSSLIENFNHKENTNQEIISKNISEQQENFKKRLQEKKLTRNNSEPHLHFKVNK